MPRKIRFNGFEIRPDAREVLDPAAKPVKLGSRAFDVLIVLVEHRDRVVTKDELLDTVWAGTVVEENNLAAQVSILRSKVGRDVIKTSPGRGYRFVAAVDGDDDGPADGRAAEAQTPEPDEPAGDPLRPPPPWPPDILIGRGADLAAVQQAWRPGGCITLLGAGGIGKTALALAVAQARQDKTLDGVAWVDLTEVTDPSRLPGALVQALGLSPFGAPAKDPWGLVIAELRQLELLLVLDNAEHLLEPVARLVRRVRAEARGVDVLVTSQAPLHVDGERCFQLGPLAVPAGKVDAAQALEHGAVQLLAEHARAAVRGFTVDDANVATVVALCRALDGLPLALKLAAARLPVLGLDGLAGRLGDRLRLLGRPEAGVPARQQTLLAALDWSHGLLDTPLQSVFRRLAVFSGGFPLDLVAAVAGEPGADDCDAIDALDVLVERSLVSLEGGEPPRYRLAETVRAYARLRLDEARETPDAQRRHARALGVRMAAAYEAYWGSADRPWLAGHAPELGNVRAALEWSTAHEPSLAIDLVGSTGVLFMLLGQAPEARRHFTALERAALAAETASRATARYWLERSRLNWGVANDAMLAFATKAAQQFRDIGDARGQAMALRCAIGSDALGVEQAEAALAEMTALEPHDAPPRWKAQRLMAEALVLRAGGRLADACNATDALVELTRRAGLDGMAAWALASLASLRLAAGDADEALACAQRLLQDPRARQGNFLLHPLGIMAEAHLLRGDAHAARQALADFAEASRRREWEWLAVYAGVFAWLAACEGRIDDAARVLGWAERAALRLNARIGDASSALPHARAAVEARLDPPSRRRRLEEGVRLDEAGMCAMALREGV